MSSPKAILYKSPKTVLDKKHWIINGNVIYAFFLTISDILGAEDEEDSEDDEDGDYETEEDAAKGPHVGHKIRKKLKKAKKYSKYMMPLLLAYKMKYFALVPVMIGGLILLVGATGMAGFFFALFAAVMGLQKGGY